MSKSEIKRKFDEIVAFAEIEKFIDTPVKHYSSGMYVRLAFAVAAHLEPEILLVDEVLAVGDINFQKKCLGKMGDVARSRPHRRTRLPPAQSDSSPLPPRRLDRRRFCPHDGSTHEVFPAYESAMFAGDRAKGLSARAGTKAQFLQWEIAQPRTANPTSSLR